MTRRAELPGQSLTAITYRHAVHQEPHHPDARPTNWSARPASAIAGPASSASGVTKSSSWMLSGSRNTSVGPSQHVGDT